MSIAIQLKNIIETLPDKVTLVAVSKTRSPEEILEAYTMGQRDFGENKVQEMAAKFEQLPKDIRWHMIGHLQRNKVKYIAGFVHLIHGVDTLRLLEEINRRAAQENRTIDCLLQVHIAEESSKFGFDAVEIQEIMEGEALTSLTNIRVRGLMGMATFTEDTDQILREFTGLKSLFDTYFQNHEELAILSIGMSGDYGLAITAGSTMVRIGSSIFGSRH
ncbi:YggS family pyridoxal phosphate-dependent enzyme [Robiginitalea sp.]|nr:YggS family pyridoxal phosphate-dependent enzyme [Robiginitalea sp.]